MTFSTDPIAAKSKSKAMFFHVGREPNPAPVKLCGRVLPWVERADHLGHVMHYTASQDLDINSARGSYIGTSNEILNMFSFATPAQKLTAVQTYACAWYGSGRSTRRRQTKLFVLGIRQSRWHIICPDKPEPSILTTTSAHCHQ